MQEVKATRGLGACRDRAKLFEHVSGDIGQPRAALEEEGCCERPMDATPGER
jgi:hypothetical protein